MAKKEAQPVQTEIPVYLFTGFLEAGKTKFIQETLADPRFSAGERTLVLLCEEGEVELDLSALPEGIFVEVIDDQKDLTAENMEALLRKHNAERALVEYNGMWMLKDLFQSLPENWTVYQEFSFYNSRTFLSYNANMRQLVYDKLETADCVVFNRYDDSIDQMELHKIVRGASRRAQIIYEHPDGETEYDEIEDPLPFDLDAPVIEIQDMDYALWYRDMGEEMDKYDGKKVRVKGIVGNAVGLLGGGFIIGRQVMTCCAADIRMAGLACEWKGKRPAMRTWLWVTAEIRIKRHIVYGGKKGPVLYVEAIEQTTVPDQEVAAFY